MFSLVILFGKCLFPLAQNFPICNPDVFVAVSLRTAKVFPVIASLSLGE